MTRRDTPGRGWTPEPAPWQVPARPTSAPARGCLWDRPGGTDLHPPRGARTLCGDVPADWPAGFLGPFDGKELRPRKGVTLAASQAATLPSTKPRVPVAFPAVPQLGQQGAWVPPYLSPPAPTPLAADDSLPHARCPTRDARGPRLEGDGCSGAQLMDGGPTATIPDAHAQGGAACAQTRPPKGAWPLQNETAGEARSHGLVRGAGTSRSAWLFC